MPLISVIVPIYQVEQYLNECIDSILSQSITDFELILVDDGSTDASGAICDDYAKKDDLIIVIHQENQGLSAARNSGLDIAKGEYITFIDSDDICLTDDYLKVLYEAIVKEDAQISIGLISDISNEQKHMEPMILQIYTGKDYWYYKNIGDKKGFYPHSANAKMYERNLFDNVRYPIGRIAEDTAVIHELIYPCQKIVVIDNYIYGYRNRNESIMNNSDLNKMLQDVIYGFERRRTYFLERGEEKLAKRTEIELLAHLNYHRGIKNDI